MYLQATILGYDKGNAPCLKHVYSNIILFQIHVWWAFTFITIDRINHSLGSDS